MKDTELFSPVVPENKIGKALDLEHVVTENSIEEAQVTYKRACKRLLNPPIWKELSGFLSASFKLGTPSSPDMERLAMEHDYIIIDIPGPGTVAGEGYDWVKVKGIHEHPDPAADESFGMTLQAVINPDKPDEGTAHFFEHEATSTFIIRRKGAQVIVSYHGRNERANTREPGIADKIRNSIIATGAQAGISEVQWMNLLKGLLTKEIGGSK